MLASIEHRLEISRRRIARPPLAYLIQWVCVHALRPFHYVRATPSFVRMVEGDIGSRLRGLADAGAFLYFGIRNAAQMGNPPVSLYAVDARGTVAVTGEPIIAWIFAGGAGGQGWTDASDLELDDLR